MAAIEEACTACEYDVVDDRLYVTVPVTTLWTSAAAPRVLDAPAVAERPDVERWLAGLDATDDGRLGLHGRVLTQLEYGEPVLRTGATLDGWAQVVCPWQPSSLDERGYPGFLPLSHLAPQRPSDARAEPVQLGDGRAAPPAHARRAPGGFLDRAATHLGLRYLWGGMSVQGLDCSGLVHHAMRELGVIVPRDADDQQDACEAVPLEEVRAGDLYFFARDGRRPHHVGIVTAPGRMLHAPETGGEGRILEEQLGPDRFATLVGAGRLAGVPQAG
jgi:gamma-D-glutamyl-L-lysine dipeptidyl-peptidase